MKKIVIDGGQRLDGTIEISGMKNSALPIIFACLLIKEECILENMPRVSDVENALADTVREQYPEAEVLMGTSTAGIAHAAITAHILGLPCGYVRSGAKDHGRQNQIEGKLLPGQKVVVVEDLISTGGSVIEVVEILRAVGAEVLGIVSIFTYGMKKGLVRLADANVKNVSLTDFDTIAEVAAETGYIADKDIDRLLRFRDNPSDESWMEVR